MKTPDRRPDPGILEDQVAQCYSTWGKSYYEDYYGQKASYPPVHVDLIRSRIRAAGVKSLLDAGCGPASFLRHLAGDGMELYGFDLTTEMIEEAKNVMARYGLPRDHFWKGSVLNPVDFVRPGLRPGYDAAVCLGVFPHIPAEYDETVLKNLHTALSSGGLIFVEARNALFSLFTQNRYSYQFIREELIRADNLIAASGASGNAVAAALDEMQKHFRMDLPPVRKGKGGEPGYDEVLSRTHIPFVLQDQLRRTGFRNIQILFYHYHALPPMFSDSNPQFFTKASLALENPEDWRGHFMASAFVLVGRKN